ncbi:MAG: metallophosphoesterase [Thermodesulfovibrionia bacterium]
MLLFLVFHGSYALAHLYLFFKIEGIFHIGKGPSLLIGVFLFIMAFSPMVIYFYSLRGRGGWLKGFAFLGYLWMGFMILFFFPSIFIDLYNFVVSVSGVLFKQDTNRLIFPSQLSFFIPFITSVSLTTYGYFRAGSPVVKRIRIKTDKLPNGIDNIRVVQLSDMHLGIIVGEGLLDKVIEKIRGLNPDIIVSTGDLIDGGIEHIQHLKDKLRSMDAPLGKFAIIGNHEFYTGIRRSQEFLEEVGFKVLRGEWVNVNGLINIVGIDDGEGKDMSFTTETEILNTLPCENFTILLKHKPEVDDKSIGLFDLQLSGHTHNGQIFPINIIVRLLFYPHSSYRELFHGSAIYVSGGVGTAGPPVRLFSQGEISVFEIQRA